MINAKTIIEIKSGNEKALGFLIGQAMKESKGKANPKKLNEIFTRRINNEESI